MKNPMQKFRRFFFRGKKYNASATRAATAHGYDDDEENSHRLSGAFVAVLLLHVIAIVGVFAFARIKEKHKSLAPPDASPVAGNKSNAGKSKAAKPVVEKPAAPAAQALFAMTNPMHDTIKTPQAGHRATYIVKTDDSLSKIAFAFKVDVEDLITVNKLKNRDDIKAGQPLTIPDSKPVSKIPAVVEAKPPVAAPPLQKSPTPAIEKKTPKTYIVKKNDTAVKIARENGCTYEELVKLNNIKDPKKIQLGQVLKLPVKSF